MRRGTAGMRPLGRGGGKENAPTLGCHPHAALHTRRCASARLNGRYPDRDTHHNIHSSRGQLELVVSMLAEQLVQLSNLLGCVLARPAHLLKALGQRRLLFQQQFPQNCATLRLRGCLCSASARLCRFLFRARERGSELALRLLCTVQSKAATLTVGKAATWGQASCR